MRPNHKHDRAKFANKHDASPHEFPIYCFMGENRWAIWLMCRPPIIPLHLTRLDASYFVSCLFLWACVDNDQRTRWMTGDLYLIYVNQLSWIPLEIHLIKYNVNFKLIVSSMLNAQCTLPAHVCPRKACPGKALFEELGHMYTTIKWRFALHCAQVGKCMFDNVCGAVTT